MKKGKKMKARENKRSSSKNRDEEIRSSSKNRDEEITEKNFSFFFSFQSIIM
jgi:hypothetical protein